MSVLRGKKQRSRKMFQEHLRLGTCNCPFASKTCFNPISFILLPFHDGVLLCTYNLMDQIHVFITHSLNLTPNLVNQICVFITHDLNSCAVLLLKFTPNRSRCIWCRREHRVTIIPFNTPADIYCVNTADFKYEADLMEKL